MHTGNCLNCGTAYSCAEGNGPAYCSNCGTRIAPPGNTLDPDGASGKQLRFSRTELIGAALSYIAAYFYVIQLDYSDTYWPVLLPAAFLIGLTMVLNKGRKAAPDSWIWFGCLCASVVCYTFNLGRVWERYHLALFMHGFAVWWILSRNGLLLEPDRFDLFPSNILTGFILLPFQNLLLRIRTIAGSIRQFILKRGRIRINGWLVPAVILCILLFWNAIRLLGKADTLFGEKLSEFAQVFCFDLGDDFFDFLIHLFFSIPVGCFLFGMISGAHRLESEQLEKRTRSVDGFLERIRKIPKGFWVGAIVLFSVLYLAFFILQGSYLFGAFTGKLPEGFIVSEYARQGFFELCKIMAVNALLLWLTTHLSICSVETDRRLRIFCLILLLESILFAVIAFSKLALYISIYGFTPLRLQSSWLVCVLCAGCILWIVHLFTQKRVFRIWMVFSAVTLTLLMFY